MAITVPGTAVNYPNALLAVGLKTSCVPGGQTPKNGPQCVPAEIDWGSMGGTSHVVGFNIGNAGGTRAFEDICALHVDNSGCGSDVQFIFTDTQETYTIPAYAPYVLIPIFTKSLQFYVVAGIDSEVVESNDTTRFSLFNFVPPPVTVPLSEEQDLASVGGIDMGTASTAIIPAGINGTLEDVWLFVAMNATNSGNGTWKLQDGAGTPNVIAQGALAVSAGGKYNITLLQLQNVKVRFTNGLNLVCTQTAVLGATIQTNVYYRTP